MNTDQRILQILENSACLSKGQLLGYIKHTLYPEELRAVELHLSTCSLCNDALEGLETQADAEQLLASLVPPVLPYVAPREKPKEKKDPLPAAKLEKPVIQVAPPPKNNNPTQQHTPADTDKVQRLKPGNSWRKPLGIAAALVLGIGALWYFVTDKKQKPDQLAQETTSRADTVAKAADTGNPRLAAAMELEEQKAKTLAAEKKHKDSLFLVRREETRTRARKDSMARLAAGNTRQAGESQAFASRSATAEKESTAVNDVVAKRAIAAAPAAMDRNKEDHKKEESKEPKRPQSDYELGMQKYKEKNYASALLYFKSAESDKGDPKHWEATYYSALCNKNLDKKRKAVKLFERVVDANAPQKKAAQKQLDELKKKD